MTFESWEEVVNALYDRGVKCRYLEDLREGHPRKASAIKTLYDFLVWCMTPSDTFDLHGYQGFWLRDYFLYTFVEPDFPWVWIPDNGNAPIPLSVNDLQNFQVHTPGTLKYNYLTPENCKSEIAALFNLPTSCEPFDDATYLQAVQAVIEKLRCVTLSPSTEPFAVISVNAPTYESSPFPFGTPLIETMEWHWNNFSRGSTQPSEILEDTTSNYNSVFKSILWNSTPASGRLGYSFYGMAFRPSIAPAPLTTNRPGTVSMGDLVYAQITQTREKDAEQQHHTFFTCSTASETSLTAERICHLATTAVESFAATPFPGERTLDRDFFVRVTLDLFSHSLPVFYPQLPSD